jgi:hypothetical protein
MNNIEKGTIVKPLTGYWKGIKGKVVNIYEDIYPIEVMFEDGDINRYYPEQLEVQDKFFNGYKPKYYFEMR